MKKFKRMLVYLAVKFLYFLHKTCRVIIKYEAPLPNSPVIYAGWHGVLPILFFIFKDKQIVTMVSQSEDGELIAPAFERAGFKVIRGSSHRGGVLALKKMVKIVKQGYSAGLAIDGSRGPLRKVQGGALFLAMHSNYPLIPLNVFYKHSIKLPTWDKMEIPLPFTKIAIVYGRPFYVKKGINETEFETIRLELEKYLFHLKDVGEKLLT